MNIERKDLLFWAKKPRGKESTTTAQFHPLICHMIDTAMVFWQLWVNVLADSIKEEFTVALGERAREILACIIGVHDIGKVLPWFTGLSEYAKEELGRFGFSFLDSHEVAHNLITAAFLKQINAENDFLEIALVLGCHHGIVPSPSEIIEEIDLLEDDEWNEARTRLYSILLQLFKVDFSPHLLGDLSRNPALLVKLAGLTVVSDWLASAEEYFPYIADDKIKELDLEKYKNISLQQACEALKKTGWAGWTPNREIKTFESIFGFSDLRLLQKKAVEVGALLDKPTMIIVEAPMGEGKTEAALYLAERLQTDAGQKGIYFALPTQATSNQMFGRMKEFLTTVYPESIVNLHLTHGQNLLSDEYQQLRLGAINIEAFGKGRVVAEEWFATKKRALLAPFAVGTVDQALNSVLNIRHGFLRLYALANKVIVIDEVHSYDFYTSKLLDRMIEWLSILGSSIIILSATLPRKRREELLAAYGAEVKSSRCWDLRYPRITWSAKGTSPEGVTLEESSRSAKKRIELRHLSGNAEEIALKAVEILLNHNGCIAWICNTIGKAQKLYDILEPLCREAGIELELFHARFLFGDRQELEKRICAKYGKNSLKLRNDPAYQERPVKSILIATQIVEQSLDLDFDLMITDIAPIDFILQRLGRLQRHGSRLRSQFFAEPEVWLIEPGVNKEGLPDFGVDKKIYLEYILLRTWLLIKDIDEIILPDNIETFIEEVYDESVELGDDNRYLRNFLAEAKNDAERQKREYLACAENQRIKTPYENDISFLERFNSDAFDEDNPEANPKVRAATRLVQPSVSLICLYGLGRGQLSLDKAGKELVIFDKKPDNLTAKKLLLRSVTITHPGVVKFFNEQGTRPEAWESHPLLCSHYCAALRDDKFEIGKGVTLYLDSIKGIVISKGTEVNGKNWKSIHLT